MAKLMGNVLLLAENLSATIAIFILAGGLTSSLALIVGSYDSVIRIAIPVAAGTRQFASSCG
jgi:hypothetical protein